MRPVKVTANLVEAVALVICLVPVGRAEPQPSPQTTESASLTQASKKTDKPKPGAAGSAEPTYKRDPFKPLVAKHEEGGSLANLPPGKAGLQVSTTRVDGMVRSPNGMIAVVSNPQQRVYFLRDGDRLYDGEVVRIGLDGVQFRQFSKDAFGKPVERMVTKRLYPSAGEQQ
jgi:hypothetical protein